MVRVSPSHLRTLSEAEKTLCTLQDTSALQFQDMARRLPNSTYLDLVDQTEPDHEEFERPLSGFENPEASSRVILPTPNSAGNSAPAGPVTPAPDNPFTLPPSSSTEAPVAPAPAPAPAPSPAPSRPQREHEDAEMTEPRTRPSDEILETNPVKRRVRQKTTPAFATSEIIGGSGDEEGGFSYEEALPKSSPHLIGFSKSDT